jgi:hypothetical protein
MKVGNVVIIVFLMAINCKTSLNGQVKLGLFSHSEFFYSPNESYDTLKSFYRGYNKSNFSSNFAFSISYQLNSKLGISAGIQRVNRTFDCDCVNTIARMSTVYYIGNSSCELQLKATYRILQFPLSIKYSFSSNNQNLSHSLGIGNTFIYNLGRENLFYDSSGSLILMFGRHFITFLSPEIYYQLDTRLSKHASANFSFGIREEITKQVNHAFFGKLGVGYSFGKMPKSKRKRK